MKTFDMKKGGAVVYKLAEAVRANREYLSEIDGATGDGDHGINMSKGFTLCKDWLEDKKDATGFAEALSELGDVLLSEIGGSMGPLYGSFFLEMADAAQGVDALDGQGYLAMLRAGLTGIQALVPTQVGDKSLLDVLVPATDKLEEALAEGADFGAALQAHVEAAEAAREATKDMVAKVGRASRLGERSRGHYDAGATSCAIILKALAQGIADSLE